MTVQFHGKDMSSMICCYSLWLGRAVLHGLCKLSEPLISNWCSNSHRISWWKLSQVPVNPHNPPILCLGVVGRTMVTREASIRIWKGNPRPATILPNRFSVEITLRQAFPFTMAAITLSLWDVANHFERPIPLSPSCRLDLPLKRFVTHAFITGHLKEL